MNLGKDYEKAVALMEEGDWKKAIKLLSDSIQKKDDEVEYYSKRGVCFLNLERYDESMKDFNMALTLEPDYAYRYACRAFLKTRIKDFKGAVEDYEIAIKLDPEDPILYNNLGLIVEQMGSVKRAEGYFSEANKLEGYDPNIRSNNKSIADFSEETIAQSALNAKNIAKKVFTDKSTFREFLNFIKRGFKIKK